MVNPGYSADKTLSQENRFSKLTFRGIISSLNMYCYVQADTRW
jgi:hypothetical protein